MPQEKLPNSRVSGAAFDNFIEPNRVGRTQVGTGTYGNKAIPHINFRSVMVEKSALMR